MWLASWDWKKDFAWEAIVLCPDPTQLTWGEGVWCHKSKSLGYSSRSLERPIKSQIGIIQKWEQILQSYRSKCIMRFIIQRWEICKQLQGFNTSPSPRIQACDTRPFPRERVGSGHETKEATCSTWLWLVRAPQGFWKVFWVPKLAKPHAFPFLL